MPKTKKEIKAFQYARKARRVEKAYWREMMPLLLSPPNKEIQAIAEMFRPSASVTFKAD